MKKTLKESEIIAGLHRSDEAVFDQLFNGFYNRLVYFACRLTGGNLHEAQDIVIETFRKFWERRDSFFTMLAIKGFLRVTIKNACLNYLRSQARLQKRAIELGYQHSDQFEMHAEYLILEADIISQIYAQINNLPKKSRAVFMLKYFKGLSVSEIADLKNISEHTVRNHIAYSLKLLRNVLGSRLLTITLFYLSTIQERTCPAPSAHIYFESHFSIPPLFESPRVNLTKINN